MISEEQFRTVMGHFATGVTVVASRDLQGRPVGLTVNAFTSVSLNPPLVLICIHRQADAHDALLEAGHFGISILTADQGELALRFSRDDPGVRFRELPLLEGSLGSPIISGALAWLQCRVQATYPGGDHTILLGEVTDGEAGEGEALIFFRGVVKGLKP